jgi:HPt (histidine-containing phosphotransfer) domain-containing protein
VKDPAAQQKSAPGTTSGAGLAVFDRADALARVDGDDALLATLLALALDDMPLRLEQLEAALQAHDGRAATLQAHNLKGAAATVGALALAAAAGAVELALREARQPSPEQVTALHAAYQAFRRTVAATQPNP